MATPRSFGACTRTADTLGRLVASVTICALLAPLLVAGCGSRQVASDPAAALKAPFTDQTTEAGIEALATAGVQVYDGFSDTSPIHTVSGLVSPLRFTRWQVENMARESTASNGYPGSVLDGLIPPDHRTIPVSYIVAAWIMRGQSDAARLAQRLMGAQDWRAAPRLLYPTIVLALFVGDLTRRAEPPGGSKRESTSGLFAAALPALAIARSGLQSPLQVAKSDPCTAIENGFYTMLADIFAAIKLNEAQQSPLLSAAAKLANIGLLFAQGAIWILVGKALEQLKAVLAPVITILSTLSLASSLLHNWALSVVADPPATEYSIDQLSHNYFDFTASVDPGSPWPSELVGCVKTLSGVDLTTIGSQGSVVSWNVVRGGLAFPLMEQTHLDKHNNAISRFYANSESQTVHDTGQAVTKHVVAYVIVQRGDYQKIKDIVVATIANQLPPQIPGFIKNIIKANLAIVLNQVHVFPDPKGNGSEAVTFHVPSSPSPAPSASSSPIAGPVCSDISIDQISSAFGEAMKRVPPNFQGPYSACGYASTYVEPSYHGQDKIGVLWIWRTEPPQFQVLKYSNCDGIPNARCSSANEFLMMIDGNTYVQVLAVHESKHGNGNDNQTITVLTSTELEIARDVAAKISSVTPVPTPAPTAPVSAAPPPPPQPSTSPTPTP